MSQVDSRSTKKSKELTLIDKLSRLSYQQTLKLLGSDAPKLLRAGVKWDFRIEEDGEGARGKRMTVKSADPDQPWTDCAVSSTVSGKTYRVAVRGGEPGASYCSCPDFRTNRLGTCKHILHVLAKLKRRFTAGELQRPYERKTISVHVGDRDPAAPRLLFPAKLGAGGGQTLGKLRGRAI